MSRVGSFSLPAVLALALVLSWGCSSAEETEVANLPEGKIADPDHWSNDPLLPDPPDVEVYTAVESSFSDEPEGMDDPRVLQIRAMGTAETFEAKPVTEETVQTVLSLALADPVLPAVQEEALDALENFGWRGGRAEAAVEAIGELLRAGEPRVRARAVEALEFVKTERSTELLLGALSDPNAQVRSDACSALVHRVRPEHHEIVKSAYLKEGDRSVKVDLWELLENIAIERQKAKTGQPEAGKGADA